MYEVIGAIGTGAHLAHAPLALAGGPTTLKVGVTAGPHAEIMEQVKKQAAAQGLDIQVVEFSDYVQPNAALASGDLQANSYQHQPYLDQQVADRGYKIVSVAKTVAFPMGVYSKKHASLKDLPEGARIDIPNGKYHGEPPPAGRTATPPSTAGGRCCVTARSATGPRCGRCRPDAPRRRRRRSPPSRPSGDRPGTTLLPAAAP